MHDEILIGQVFSVLSFEAQLNLKFFLNTTIFVIGEAGVLLQETTSFSFAYCHAGYAIYKQVGKHARDTRAPGACIHAFRSYTALTLGPVKPPLLQA